MAMSDTDTEDDYCYEMNKAHRGYFLINSVERFSRSEFNQRFGNEADIERLERTFGRLGFITTRVSPDPTSAQMLEAVNELASLDHTNFDCVGMAIMSHGDVDENRDDIIYGSDGTSKKLKDLLVPLKNHPGLRGKPKLIFVQACRGHELDRGSLVYTDDAPSQQTHQLDCASVDATHDVEEQLQELSLDSEASEVETQAAVADTSHSTDGNRPPTAQLLEALQQATEIELSAPMLPLEVDFLIHFSTPRGYYSWREQTGSVFAQTLCDVLDEYVNNEGPQKYLNELLEKVNNRVACSYVSVNDRSWLSGCKLMPVVMMKLRKSIILPRR